MMMTAIARNFMTIVRSRRRRHPLWVPRLAER